MKHSKRDSLGDKAGEMKQMERSVQKVMRQKEKKQLKGA